MSLCLHRHRVRHGSSRPAHIVDEARRDGYEDLTLLLDVDRPDIEPSTIADSLDLVDEWLFGIRGEHEMRLERVECEA